MRVGPLGTASAEPARLKASLMRVRSVRVPFVLVAGMAWLTGCGSWDRTAGLLSPSRGSPAASAADTRAGSSSTATATAETTGTVPTSSQQAAAASASPAPDDPDDDLGLGKRHFREGNFGLAERYFRHAIDQGPGDAHRSAEAWLGLAASYDRLRRFELADRAYGEALRILGPTAEVLNNQGYSYLLRGDFRRARAKLDEARDLDPTSPYIRNNLALLEQSARGTPR